MQSIWRIEDLDFGEFVLPVGLILLVFVAAIELL